MTPKERVFIEHMARTNDATYAAEKAGYAAPSVSGGKMARNDRVMAHVRAEALKALQTELLPLAIATHRRLLSDAAVPAGAQVQAVKLAYDKALGEQDGKSAKDLADMSYDELMQSIADLQQAIDAKAEGAKDVTPAPESGGFFD